MNDRQLRRAFEVSCVTYGFCISKAAREEIAKLPDLDDKMFARLVVEAEGLDAKNCEWISALENVFRESAQRP